SSNRHACISRSEEWLPHDPLCEDRYITISKKSLEKKMNLNSILESINSTEKDKDDDDKFYKDLYEILGCTSSCTTEQISTEYKKRALNCHPDKVKDENAKKKFYQLSTAYNILTDEIERSQYDRWRTGSIKIPYKMWREMVMRRGHTVHWTSPPKQPLKITDSLDTETSSNQSYNNNTHIKYNTSKFGRKSRQDDLYEKFRNYEI
ncbi:6984_t:CDS:2, partial [Cetraspora pellucida]